MKTYIIFDLETTGFGKDTEIIEISALKVENDKIIDSFDSLVCPSTPISADITALTGITNDMVNNAPLCEDILPEFIDFIGNDTLVGHNITTYDMPILRRLALNLLNITISNPIVDTLYLSKHKLSLDNYKLITIATYFNIDYSQAHRALNDCYITLDCYLNLKDLPDINKKSASCTTPSSGKKNIKFSDSTKALQTLNGFLMGIIADNQLTDSEIITLNSWLDDNKNLEGQYPFDRVFSVVKSALADGIITDSERNDLLHLFQTFSNPTATSEMVSSITFTGNHFCVTGEFESYSRTEIETIIQEKEGICDKSVTRKTNYLIVGSKGNANWTCETYGSKVKKAMEYNEKGSSILIIREENFLSEL